MGKPALRAHPSVLRALQQRDWIAALVRRNAEGEEEQALCAHDHSESMVESSEGP